MCLFMICTEASLCRPGTVNPNSVDKKGSVNHLHGLTCFPENALKMSVDILRLRLP